ncbi:hypothetical protein [Nostoc flagelliforme]|uniref:hypothetical protein n=1 Tax=Nostoc flagelliforme TaxID=1306274 RepID=UPI0021F1FDEB|nr:hypothetical protein [Nostoc flagelliforme]
MCSVKTFQFVQEKFRLNPQKYEQVILTICRLVRLRIRALIFIPGRNIRYVIRLKSTHITRYFCLIINSNIMSV